MGYKQIKREAFGKMCRECINKTYDITLESAECKYLYYAYQCKNCGEVRTIVEDVDLKGRWKILMRQKKNNGGKE